MPGKSKLFAKKPTAKVEKILLEVQNFEVEETRLIGKGIELSASGKTVTEISKALKVGAQRPRNWINKYNESPVAYLQGKLDIWTKAKIIKGIQEAHRQWAKGRIKPEDEFNYEFLRKHSSALLAQIDNRKFFNSLGEAYIASGINPNCHMGAMNYGNTNAESKKTFVKVIIELSESLGVENFNDNSMNSSRAIPIPSVFRCHGDFTECKKHQCAEKEISLQSIYRQGCLLFNSWRNALSKAGYDYDKDILRKVASRTREEYINDFVSYIRGEKGEWTIDDLKYHHNHGHTYAGLYDSHKKSVFYKWFKETKEHMLCAYVEAEFTMQDEITCPEVFYNERSSEIKDRFRNEIRLQEQWDKKRIQRELLKRYGQGERITREALEKSNAKKDTTLLAATRRRGRKGSDHNASLAEAGFIADRLTSLYEELDDPYPIERIFCEFQRLVRESLENKENRLSREYCSEYEKRFHDTIIRKYKSWEAGLRKFGLDSKIFALSAKKRAKRGYAFERFFQETLERYGFRAIGASGKLHVKSFIRGKKFSGCSHKIKCKPDFLFEGFIIDTKTGYAAKRQEQQLERYLGHRSVIWVVTLRGAFKQEIKEGGVVNFINFSEFIEKSKGILGVQLDPSENQRLTQTLRNAEWDPFVDLE